MTERDHLDPATIAALVDRTLDAAPRAAAEAHLAACADCREVWVETSEMAEAMRGGRSTDTANARATVIPHRPRSRRWVYAGGALAAAAALVLAVVLPQLFDRGERPELRELVEAVGQNRRTEARVTGGFEWGPVPGVTRGGGNPPPADVQLALGQLLTRRAQSAEARTIAAAGIGHLMAGNIDGAVSELDGASRIAPGDAAIWSDLASAYLERARLAGDAGAASDALRAADRALAIAPDLAEARFNRALALSYLDRAVEERAAWDRYLAVDGSGAWADEARRRRDRAIGSND